MSINLKEKNIASDKIEQNAKKTEKTNFLKKLKISIFDRYIFMSVCKAVFACIFLFMIVWIAPETLFNTIRQAMKFWVGHCLSGCCWEVCSLLTS